MTVVINFAAAGGGGGSSGGGAWGTITGNLPDQTDLEAQIVTLQTSIAATAAGSINLPSAWNASTNTPTLASSTAATFDAYQVTVAGSTTLDGVTPWAVGDIALFGAAGVSTWTKIPGGGFVGIFATMSALTTAFPAATYQGSWAQIGSGSNWQTYISDGTAYRIITSNAGVPSTHATGYTLLNNDNTTNLIISSNPALTINTGLVSGFGCGISGAFTTAGTATITDKRVTSGVAWCALVNTGTDTYDLVGTK